MKFKFEAEVDEVVVIACAAATVLVTIVGCITLYNVAALPK